MAAEAAVNGTRKSSRAKTSPQVNGKAETAAPTKTTKASKVTKAKDDKPPLSEKSGNARATKQKRPAVEPESEDEQPQPAKKQKSPVEDAKENKADVESSKPKRQPPKKKAPAKKGTTGTSPRPRKTARSVTNALPAPPAHERPAYQLFVWGAGNFGQFGMGPTNLDEFDKPKRNTWIEKKIEEGAFGGEGAGLESVAAGGLHTMFIDEKGTVSGLTSFLYDIPS